MTNQISVDLLREIFFYDPGTGRLFWRKRGDRFFLSKTVRRGWNTKYAGKIAGCPLTGRSGVTYLRIGFRGKFYLAHRIVWALHYGAWPSGEIDHIDGDGQNNKISNLRVANNTLNQRNRVLARNNTSGATGIRFERSTSKWIATIKLDGKLRHIGCYSNFDDAVAARKKAEAENGFTPRHGEPDRLSRQLSAAGGLTDEVSP